MEPKIVVKFKNLDTGDFTTKLKKYIDSRFRKLLILSVNERGLMIEYKNGDYHLELPIFFGENEISFYAHFWKIDSGNIGGFGSFLQHLIKSWIYSEFSLAKPENTDLNLKHFKFKNYNNWQKYILKNRSLLFKILTKINSSVPKELTKL